MKKKVFAFVLSFLLLVSLVISPSINVKAETANAPNFTITNWKTTPNPAMRGEDITVSGTINPEPFEMDIPEKDIVLVLDLSGSMNDNISGTKTSKISALKAAAKKFIENMQSEKNLKISIVGYSSLATINPNGYIGTKSTRSLDSNYSHDVYKYNSLGESFFDINTDKDTLNSMIDNLAALGGTNTGEGLRKAAYMLSKMPASNNKSIILMSDGLPTFSTGNYYTEEKHQVWIDGYYKWDWVWVQNGRYGHYEYKQVWVEGRYEWVDGGTKWSDYLEINSEDHSYGGSGSDDKDDRCSSYAKQIGAILKTYVNNVFSIGYGLGDDKSEGNVTLNEIHDSMGGLKDNYYKTSDNIDGIFSSIATEIKNKYAMNNIKMSMNLNSNFTLNIGGNTISIPTVDYRLVSENNGKARYEAEPVDFSFIVKGNKNGNDQDIFDDADLKFDWNDSEVSIKVDESPKANIINNLNPKIEANLISPDRYESKLNDVQTINYQIKPNDFKSTANDYDGKKEVVFLLDTSSNMQNSTQWKNGVMNDMVNALVNSDASKTKAIFNFITYDSSVNTNIVNTEEKDQNNVSIDYRNKIQNIVNGVQVSGNNERKLGEALTKAKDLLDSGDKDAVKNIVIIGAGNPTDTMPQNYSNNGYNIITLSINKTQNSGNEFNELKNWHKALGGKDDNYFYSTTDYNNIANNIVKEMAKKLEGYNKTVRRFTDVSVNLNFGSNLEYVDKSINGFDVVKNGDKLTIKLPVINYYLSGDADSDGRYTYKADSFDCSFEVKVTNFTDNKAEFLNANNTDYNNIAYTKISGEYEKEAIKTPIFINALNIIHGVYEGKGKIDTTNNLSYAKGTVVPMAASFTYTGSIEPHISVENGSISGIPVVYKLNKETNELEKVAVFSKADSTIITTGLKEGDTAYILYNIKLSEDSGVKKCTSTITVDKNTFPASINISDEPLPDLY